MLQITETPKTETPKKERRPACAQCSGTGFVYLWSVARSGTRTWYCDRCKRSWAEAESTLTVVPSSPILEPLRLVPPPAPAIVAD